MHLQSNQVFTAIYSTQVQVGIIMYDQQYLPAKRVLLVKKKWDARVHCDVKFILHYFTYK